MTAAAGLTSLGAFDKTTGWDLDTQGVRRQVEEAVDTEKPWRATMSPPCRMLSKLQKLSRVPKDLAGMDLRLQEGDRLREVAPGAS